MTLTRSCILPTVFIVFFGLPAASFSRSIEQDTKESQLVLIGRLTRVVEDAGPTTQQARDAAAEQIKQGASPLSRLAALNGLRGKGTYSFAVRFVLKGRSPENVDVYIPQAVNALSYGTSRFDVKEGRDYLLFLSTRDRGWGPVDPKQPLIPMTKDVMPIAVPTDTSDDAVTVIAVRLMLAGVDDLSLRALTLRLLSGTRNPEVVAAARRFWDDPDYFVQSAALWCLAVNQVAEAVPRIIDAQHKTNSGGKGDLGLLPKLGLYNSPDVLLYLNRLLFDPDPGIRLQIMLSLRDSRLADRSSVPYLMVALLDPNPVVAGAADVTLHELIPELGPWKGQDDFLQHREEEIKSVERWWVDELAGKHKDDVPLVRPRSANPSPAAPQSPAPRSGRGPAD